MPGSHQGPPEPFVVAFEVGVTPDRWARIWAERMPQHPLVLRQQSHPDILAALSESAVNMALLRLPLDRDDLARIALYEEQTVVVAPEGHAFDTANFVTMSDLTGEVMRSEEWADAVGIVASGTGVALMPQSVAHVLGRRDVIVRRVTDAPATTIVLAWVIDQHTALVDEFVGIVRGRTARSSRGLRSAAATDRVARRNT